MGMTSDWAHRDRVLKEAGRIAEAMEKDLLSKERPSGLDEMFNEAAEEICADEGLISKDGMEQALDEYAVEVETMALHYLAQKLQEELAERASHAF